MNNIVLATGTTSNYIPKIIPYLDSIEKQSNFDDNIVVALDCDIDLSKYLKINKTTLSNEKIKFKNKNNCLQHGEFLYANLFNKFRDDDFICFTDGDIILQRPLSLPEKLDILRLKENEVMLQFNAGIDDTLFDEHRRLGPKIPAHESFKDIPCYNTGVIICDKKTWKNIINYYSIVYPLVANMFDHYALQQWCLCYIFHYFMKVKIMDYSFHMHNHHGIIPNSIYLNNEIYYKSNKVLFAHYIHNISAYKK